MPNKDKTPHEIDQSGQLNSKVDQLSSALDGVMERLKRHEYTLYGDDKTFGLSQKTQIMWRAHVWLLCSLSAVMGSIITAILVGHWKK